MKMDDGGFVRQTRQNWDGRQKKDLKGWLQTDRKVIGTGGGRQTNLGLTCGNEQETDRLRRRRTEHWLTVGV